MQARAVATSRRAVPRGSERAPHMSGSPICAKPQATTSTCDVRWNHCWLLTKPVEAWRPQPLILRKSGRKESNRRFGQTLGHFQILAHLGSGGMGEVYLAEDKRLRPQGRAQAVACTLTAVIPSRLRRFEQEARAASALNHPNILTIHEIGEARQRARITSSPSLSKARRCGR